jgi:hypothetical protein
MQVITEPDDIWRRSHTRELYEKIATSPVGTTFILQRGEDFPDTDSVSSVRQRVISAMRHRGWRTETRIKGDTAVAVRLTTRFKED